MSYTVLYEIIRAFLDKKRRKQLFSPYEIKRIDILIKNCYFFF